MRQAAFDTLFVTDRVFSCPYGIKPSLTFRGWGRLSDEGHGFSRAVKGLRA